MTIHKLPLGLLSANCYIIETDYNNAVAVDIGGEWDKLSVFLAEHSLNLKAILVTHGHYDHIDGIAAAQRDTSAEVYIHEADASKMTSRRESLAEYISGGEFQPVEKFSTVKNGDFIKIDDIDFEVIHTPGHTKGGVCYKCGNCLFTGDTLFRMSIGRTDFPDGDIIEMINSVKALGKLEGEFDVYPGHGENSTLDFERKNNPYMKEDPYEDFI